MQHIFIGAASGVTQHTVTHIAAIHIGKLVVGTGPGSVGQTGSPQHPQTCVDMVNRYRGFDKLFAQHIGQTCVQSVVVRLGSPLHHQLAVVPKRKAHIGSGQSMAAQRL